MVLDRYTLSTFLYNTGPPVFNFFSYNISQLQHLQYLSAEVNAEQYAAFIMATEKVEEEEKVTAMIEPAPIC